MTLVTGLVRTCAVAALFAALAVGVYQVARAPGGIANTRGIRGLRRLRAERESAWFAAVEPMLRWLGVRIQPLLTGTARSKLDRQLTLSGDFLGLLPEELVALACLCSFSGCTVGAAYAAVAGKGALYAVLGALLGAFAPYLKLHELEQSRRRAIQNGLPYAVDLVALGLSAGLDFPGALGQVVEKSSNPNDPLIEELNLVLQELQVGKTRRDALAQFSERVPTDSVLEFVNTVTQAEESGNPLGRVLQIQAEVSRQRRSVRAEEAASRASVKMIGPLVLLFAAILLLIVTPMVLELGGSFAGGQ